MESAADITKYLTILQGELPKENITESTDVDLGISTHGAKIGNLYIFENGIRWAKIIGDAGDNWAVEHGLIEHESDDVTYVSKQDMSKMIREGEMELYVDEANETDILEETLVSSNDLFEEYMNKVDRILLVNENAEHDNYDYDWEEAFDLGLTPFEAVEEAVGG